MTYTLDTLWSKTSIAQLPVNDCKTTMDVKVVLTINATIGCRLYSKPEEFVQIKIFVHPHDVCADRDGNIYVAQWASGKVYPYKLTRA